MVKWCPQCRHRADFPAAESSKEPVTAQEGQAKVIFMRRAPLGTAAIDTRTRAFPAGRRSPGCQAAADRSTGTPRVRRSDGWGLFVRTGRRLTGSMATGTAAPPQPEP